MATIQAINECLEALKKTPTRNIINENPVEIDQATEKAVNNIINQ